MHKPATGREKYRVCAVLLVPHTRPLLSLVIELLKCVWLAKMSGHLPQRKSRASKGGWRCPRSLCRDSSHALLGLLD